jgi:hypothetical protein
MIYRGKRLVNWDTHLHTAVAVHPEDERYKKFIGRVLKIIKRGKPSPRSNRPFAHHRKQWAFYATPSAGSVRYAPNNPATPDVQNNVAKSFFYI